MHRYIYSRQAATQLAKNPKHLGLPLASEWVRNKAHGVKTNFSAISAAVSLMTLNEQANREVQAGWTEEQAAAYMEQKMGKVSCRLRGKHSSQRGQAFNLYTAAHAVQSL